MPGKDSKITPEKKKKGRKKEEKEEEDKDLSKEIDPAE